jgi:hypothetical protein
VPADEAWLRRQGRQFRGHIVEQRIPTIGDDVSALEHVRRHEEIAGVDTPAFCFQGAAHARGSRERVVNRSDANPTPLQRAEDEWKEPGLVSDVPHDAKEGEVVGLAL